MGYVRKARKAVKQTKDTIPTSQSSGIGGTGPGLGTGGRSRWTSTGWKVKLEACLLPYLALDKVSLKKTM